MTEQKSRDKNLQNVVKDLEKPDINAFYNHLQQQKTDDRRHWDAIRGDEEGKESRGGLHHVKT
jgi:hypothetical protein